MSLVFYTGVILLAVGTASFVVWNIWYTNKLRNHLVNSLADIAVNLKTIGGRLITAEHSLQQCKADHSETFAALSRTCENIAENLKQESSRRGEAVAKVQRTLKSLNEQVDSDLEKLARDQLNQYEDVLGCNEIVHHQLKALLKELGYEITTTTGETVSTVTKHKTKLRQKAKKGN